MATKNQALAKLTLRQIISIFRSVGLTVQRSWRFKDVYSIWYWDDGSVERWASREQLEREALKIWRKQVKTWTSREIARVWRLKKAGKTNSEIGKVVGRSQSSIHYIISATHDQH